MINKIEIKMISQDNYTILVDGYVEKTKLTWSEVEEFLEENGF